MLKVHVGTQQVGELFRSDLDATHFNFQYIVPLEDAQAVSITMPIVRDAYLSKFTLHPIFDMNLPEGDLASRLRREFSKTIRNFDDLSLLEIVGHSQIGRLNFRSANNADAYIESQNIQDLLLYDGVEGLFDSLFEKYASHSGISGVQPKVMVRDSSSTKNDSISRLSHRGATHIVKAWNASEFPQLAANEFFCMRAALHSGLPVANFEISQNGVFFITERFDLKEGGYLGFEDFCVLNGLTALQKYQGSYEGITKRIRDYISPEYTRSALLQFYKTLALSCAVRNGDAHLKNFGVLYQDASSPVSLAPTYDIVTTTVYVAQDSMALTLNGSKRWPKSAELIRFAEQHCGLTAQRARNCLDEVKIGVLRATNEINAYTQQHPELLDFNHKLKEEWRKGVEFSIDSGSRLDSNQGSTA